jgi:hypothetical protein
MDQELSELKKEVETLKEILMEHTKLLNNIILIMHLSETDLKNHFDLLDS